MYVLLERWIALWLLALRCKSQNVMMEYVSQKEDWWKWWQQTWVCAVEPPSITWVLLYTSWNRALCPGTLHLRSMHGTPDVHWWLQSFGGPNWNILMGSDFKSATIWQNQLVQCILRSHKTKRIWRYQTVLRHLMCLLNFFAPGTLEESFCRWSGFVRQVLVQDQNQRAFAAHSVLLMPYCPKFKGHSYFSSHLSVV